jgi:DNA-directed RNA polymerase subunit RPC12/RpoP
MEARFPCERCGAELTFQPGSRQIVCAHCGFENDIEGDGPALRERDLFATLRDLAGSAPLEDHRSIACETCAAVFEFDPGVHAEACPYCGTAVVAAPGQSRRIQPQALIPFVLSEKEGQAQLTSWLKGLWFAPSDLKHYARSEGRLSGVYLPFWTYDCETESQYSGQRGTAYRVMKRFTVRVKGKAQQRTRYVTKMRWTPAWGEVRRHFDDVLVSAGGGVPQSLTEGLSPWELPALTAYREEYLSGFRSELYRIGLEEGFKAAEEVMKSVIRRDVRQDIGGDAQRIQHIDTRYDNISFKHVLLPVWVAAFRYRGDSYPFVVNGQTGRVSGARPYSAIKIAAAVILALVLGGAALALYLASQGQLQV